jgi:geranylgeranyl pyrophosphate synthase
MLSIAWTYDPVKSDMARVDGEIEEVARLAPAEMTEQLQHALQGGGKRVRPALTLLAGKFKKYNAGVLVSMAVGVELLHTATLVHDDTIDDAQLRRGKMSIKQRWGNSNAVLIGDYLFASSARFVAETRNIRVIKLFAQTLMTICSGEIQESINAFGSDRERYFQTIGDKTACLFAAATESGAVLANSPEETVQALKEYGYNIGMSFQIVDDILDFVGQKETLGKPVASDLAQGVFTLPVILLLEQPESMAVKEILKKNRKKGTQLLMEMVRNSSAIDECYEIAQGFSSRASAAIENLPDNPAHDCLDRLATYVTERRS